MIEMQVSMKINGDKFIKSLQKYVDNYCDNVKKYKIDVGFTEESGIRYPTQEEIDYNTLNGINHFDLRPTPYATIARLHEEGIGRGRRPFMSTTREFLDNDITIRKNFVTNSDGIDWQKTEKNVGDSVEQQIKNEMVSGNWTPEEKITQYVKGKSRPLLWTEGMYNSIKRNTKVVKKK